MMTMGAIKSSQGAALLALSAALLLVVMPLSAHGQDGTQCNSLVSYSDNDTCLCNDDTLLYDNARHDCYDASTFYDSDLCGGNFYRPTSEDDCTCMTGFILNSDVCDNVDECLDPSPCASSEVCVDDDGSYITPTAEGSYYCTCTQYQYRSADDPNRCSDAHLEDNRKWNDCPQAARKAGSLLECSCFAQYAFNDTTNDGLNCQLADGYTDCTPAGSENLMCVTDLDGVDTLYVFQGYSDTLNGNGEAVDLDECNDNATDVSCWVNSQCVNLPDGQGYDCVCDDGYTDVLFQESNRTKECLPKICLEGEGPLCEGVGGNANITDGNVLQPVGCNGYIIAESFTTSIMNYGTAFRLLTGSVTVSDNINVLLCSVIQSFESVYGTGFVQATTNDNKSYNISVIVDESNTDGSTIDAMCHPLDMDSAHCMLPYGVLVAVSDSSYLAPADGLCNDQLCPETHNCVADNGSVWCECIEDPLENFYFNGALQQCASTAGTVDRLEQELEDAKKDLADTEKDLADAMTDQAVIGGVLGALLGLALIACGVMGFMIWKLKH